MKKIPNNWEPKRGDVVEIFFLDHVEDAHEEYAFFVYGRIANITKTSIRVESWAYPDEDSDDPNDPNVKCFLILRSTINRITKLVPARRRAPRPVSDERKI